MNISQRNEIAARPGSDMKNTQINNYGTFTYSLLNINLPSKIHFVRMLDFRRQASQSMQIRSDFKALLYINIHQLQTNASNT